MQTPYPRYQTKTGSFTAVNNGAYLCTNSAGAWLEVTLPASGQVFINRAGAGSVVVWGSTSFMGTTCTALALDRGLHRLWYDGSTWRADDPNRVGWLISTGLAVLCLADKGMSTSGANITQWVDQIGSRTYTPAAGTPTYSATGLTNHPSIFLTSGAYLTAPLIGADTYNTYFSAVWAGQCANPATARRTIFSKSTGTQGLTFGYLSGLPGYTRNNSNSSGAVKYSSERFACGFTRVNNSASTLHHIFNTANISFTDDSGISTYADAGTDTRIGADSAAANPYGDTPLYGFALWHTTTPIASQHSAAIRFFHLVGCD